MNHDPSSQPSPPLLSLRDLGRRWDSGPWLFSGVHFAVASGEIACLLGPSGCGKTTILRLVAGFESPDAGRIELAGRLVSTGGRVLTPPSDRGIGMVFQDPLLFPHLTVEGNVGFGLARRGTRRERQERVGELLDLLHLSPLARRYPHQISGGQRQRVSIGRALARRPALVLLDEPFASLDLSIRQELREEIFGILRHTGTATLLVTHDQEEALSVADRLAVLHDGRLEQWDTPDEVFFRPATRFVASFIGVGSFLPGRASPGGIRTEFGLLECPDPKDGDVFIRPEFVKLAQNGIAQNGVAAGGDGLAAGGDGIAARVVGTTFSGCQRITRLALPSGSTLLANFGAWKNPTLADTLRVRLELPQVLVFEPEGRQARVVRRPAERAAVPSELPRV